MIWFCYYLKIILYFSECSDWLTASEFTDKDDVLRTKIDQLAGLMRMSKKTIIYSGIYLKRELLHLTDCIHYAGAGISTSAGIASAARSSGANNLLEYDLTTDAAPSFTHRALTCLHSAGLVTDWVQQNHDGLPQKAAYPQQHVIEVRDIVSILCRRLHLSSLCNCLTKVC